MSGVDIQQHVKPGDILAGKYRIDRVLGQGGMGVVVAAHHIQLDERVAIKFLLPEAVKRAELVQRFEREARAAVKIKSEHVARVIDVGVLESGAPYMVMEFLEGVDLAARLQNEGPVPWQEAADFVLQACEAIVEAHALGIVHRDLKPANLFVLRRADGLLSIKVLDFGISKSTALSGSGPGGGSDMTQTQSMLGSPFYMSPEQMQSARSVDMRTDIWALGVILYQIVMGSLPFEAETLPELVLKIVSAPPQPMRVTRPDIPTQFEAVVMRCLEKDRDRRFQHIGELASALVPFAPDRSRSSADRILRVVQTSGLGTPNHRPSQPTVQSAQKNATQVVAPVSAPMPAAPSSPTGPGQTLQDSRPNAFHDSRPGVQGTTLPHGPGLGPPPGTLPPGMAPRFGATSSSQSWQSTPGVPKSNPLVVVVAIVGFLAVFGGLALVAIRVLHGRSATPVPSVSVSTPTPPVAVSTAVPSATVTASAPPATSTTAAAEVPDASAAPVVDAVAPVAAPVTRPVPFPAPVAAPKADCKTPYYFDDKGNRVFKKECL